MDQDSLVKPLIDVGEEILHRLDAAGVDPEVAMWFWVEEQSRWWYVVAGGALERLTPKAGYEVLHVALSGMEPPFPIGMDQVSVQRMNDPAVRLVSKMLHLPSFGGVRLTNNVVNGVTIQDAYVYRMDAQPAEPRGSKPTSTSRTGGPSLKNKKKKKRSAA